jgi:hypothetical protein
MCDLCWAGNAKHRERNVYREEDEFETPHRRKRRGKKICKRSKDGKHDFTAKRTGMKWKSKFEWETIDGGRRRVYRGGEYVEAEYCVCAKCGKAQNYMWRWA